MQQVGSAWNASHDKSERPVGAFGDADAWGHGYLDRRLLVPLAYYKRALSYIAGVLRARYAHCKRQLAGAGCQVLQLSCTWTAAEHGFDTRDGIESADQHTAGLALGLGYQVQTFVHAVDEVDVGVSGRTEDYFGTWSDATGRMRGEIFTAEVGLSLDDHAGGAAVHQDLTQKIARYFY